MMMTTNSNFEEEYKYSAAGVLIPAESSAPVRQAGARSNVTDEKWGNVDQDVAVINATGPKGGRQPPGKSGKNQWKATGRVDPNNGNKPKADVPPQNKRQPEAKQATQSGAAVGNPPKQNKAKSNNVRKGGNRQDKRASLVGQSVQDFEEKIEGEIDAAVAIAVEEVERKHEEDQVVEKGAVVDDGEDVANVGPWILIQRLHKRTHPNVIPPEQQHLRSLMRYAIIGAKDKEAGYRSIANRAALWVKTTKLDQQHGHARALEIFEYEYREAYRATAFHFTLYDRCMHWKNNVLTPKNKIIGITTAALTILYKVGLTRLVWCVGAASVGYVAWRWWHSRCKSPHHTVPAIMDYCAEKFDLSLDHAGKIDFPPDNLLSCVEKEYPVGFSAGLASVWIPRACSHNEYRALVTRQMTVPIGDPEQRLAAWAKGYALFTARFNYTYTPSDPATAMQNFLNHFPAARARVIERAIKENGDYVRVVDARTKAFIKVEKLVHKLEHKRDPRLISGKYDSFLAGTGPEYYDFQKHMCRTKWSSPIVALPERFIYTGGMDGVDLGTIVTHFETLGWYAYEGDFSRYDGHTEVEALGCELKYYKEFLSEDTMDYLSKIIKTNGRTMSGFKFKIDGKMASGLISTSLGNSIRNMMAFAYMLEDVETHWTVMVLGDDSVLFSQRKLDTGVMVERATHLGHKLEVIEHAPADYDFLSYCSMLFWNTGVQRVLGPRPGRVLCKTFIPLKLEPRQTIEDYCIGIAVGFEHYSWVPGLGEVVKKLVSRRSHTELRKLVRRPNDWEVSVDYSFEVNLTCVDNQFERVYGVGAQMYRDICESLPLRMGDVYTDATMLHVAAIDGAYDTSDEVLYHR